MISENTAGQSFPVTTTATTPTIFHEDWWLNAATNGHYKVIEVSGGGKLVGRLPYFPSRRLWMKWIAMPTITHFLGPAVDEGNGNVNARFIRRMDIMREMVGQLPWIDFLQIKCHSGIQDVIPFQEKKFRTTVQFTHEIRPAAKDVLWSNVYHKKRRVITRTLETKTIGDITDPGKFLHFYQANLITNGLRNNLDMLASHRIIEACLSRKRGRIFAVFDEKKEPTAAIFCIWDGNAYHHLLATRRHDAGSGDVSALVWEALQDASSRELTFDLGGLATVGAAFFYSGFGGNLAPRYVATRTSFPVQLVRALIRPFSEEQWFY